MATEKVKAFVDHYYPDEFSFCRNYLASPEFTLQMLKSLSSSSGNQLRKEELAFKITQALEQGSLDPKKVLLTYVKRPRMWLSLKRVWYQKSPEFRDPTLLLKTFGEQGWYGPVKEITTSRIWYIKIHEIPDFSYIGEGENRKIDKERRIRWPIIAEVTSTYIALTWEGFSCTTQDRVRTRVQFPFWIYLLEAFDELAVHLEYQWKELELHKLLLHDL